MQGEGGRRGVEVESNVWGGRGEGSRFDGDGARVD